MSSNGFRKRFPPTVISGNYFQQLFPAVLPNGYLQQVGIGSIMLERTLNPAWAEQTSQIPLDS